MFSRMAGANREMAPQLGYKGASGNLNTMPLRANPNPNNVIRIEYEVPLAGHDCDYKANTTLLLPFLNHIISFCLIRKPFKGVGAAMDFARRKIINLYPSVKSLQSCTFVCCWTTN